jgi:diaminopimelate decarboxylase
MTQPLLNKDSLPGGPHFHRRGEVLYIEGCKVSNLAREFGSPLYVYSCAAIYEALSQYQQALQGRQHLVCYAVKANSNLSVLRLFAERGCGFDIVSGGELARVLAAGAKPSSIVFSGVGKTEDELVAALLTGVKCFNVESVAELEQLNAVSLKLARRAPVSFRVNPDVDAKTHPYISTGLRDNKFGIGFEQAFGAYHAATEMPGIDVIGIDCHIGSQLTSLSPYVQALERVLDFIDRLQSQLGIRLRHLDVGGGLGIRYKDELPPTPAELVNAATHLIDARSHSGLELIVEPGRSLIGNAGALVTKVLLLKHGETKSFCVVDAGMNDLLRPALYEAWMDIVPCERRTFQVPALVDVVGPVCESGDWLGRERLLQAAPGDYLAVMSCGAYGMSMASNYNSRARPAEVMVEGSRAWLVRPREEFSELLRAELQCLPELPKFQQGALSEL